MCSSACSIPASSGIVELSDRCSCVGRIRPPFAISFSDTYDQAARPCLKVPSVNTWWCPLVLFLGNFADRFMFSFVVEVFPLVACISFWCSRGLCCHLSSEGVLVGGCELLLGCDVFPLDTELGYLSCKVSFQCLCGGSVSLNGVSQIVGEVVEDLDGAFV